VVIIKRRWKRQGRREWERKERRGCVGEERVSGENQPGLEGLLLHLIRIRWKLKCLREVREGTQRWSMRRSMDFIRIPVVWGDVAKVAYHIACTEMFP
jgi:hypothetical protein